MIGSGHGLGTDLGARAGGMSASGSARILPVRWSHVVQIRREVRALRRVAAFQRGFAR